MGAVAAAGSGAGCARLQSMVEGPRKRDRGVCFGSVQALVAVDVVARLTLVACRHCQSRRSTRLRPSVRALQSSCCRRRGRRSVELYRACRVGRGGCQLVKEQREREGGGLFALARSRL